MVSEAVAGTGGGGGGGLSKMCEDECYCVNQCSD